MSNTGPGRRSMGSLNHSMVAFDALPPAVRSAFATAAFNWSAFEAHFSLWSGRVSAAELITMVEKADRDALKRERRAYASKYGATGNSGRDAPQQRGKRQ